MHRLANARHFRSLSGSICARPCQRCGKQTLTNRGRDVHASLTQPAVLLRARHQTTHGTFEVKPPLLRRHASSGADASNDEETEAAGVSVVNPNELLDQVMLRPTQEAFHKAITTFANRPGKFKRGSVDFVYTTLQKMDEANVPLTLETYNRLFDIFPENRYATKSLFDVIWPNYTEQVDCALALLQRMEDDRMCPDVVTYDRVKAVFGSSSPPLRKLETMAYWFLKFGVKPTYEYRKRNTPRIASVYERTHAALKGIAGEGADIVSHYQDTEGDQISSAQEAKEPSYYILSTRTHLQDARYGRLKKRPAASGSEIRLQVDGPVLHYFDFTMLPYFELIAHIDDEAQSIGLCMASHQSADDLALWVNDVVRDVDALLGVDIVYSIRNVAQK